MPTMNAVIQIRHTHLASVRRDLLITFRQRFKVTNYLAWVRDMSNAIYGIELNVPAEIPVLAQALDEDFYTDIGEWLSELMRLALAQGEMRPDCARSSHSAAPRPGPMDN